MRHQYTGGCTPYEDGFTAVTPYVLFYPIYSSRYITIHGWFTLFCKKIAVRTERV